MERKRLIVSLDSLSHGHTGISSHIIFALTPTTDIKGTRLYEKAHPVVWKKFDLTYGGQTRIFDWNAELGVCTVQKTTESCLKPVLSRIIRPGYRAALVLDAGHPTWSKAKKLQNDWTTTIIVTNDLHIPQSFAICTSVVENDNHDPTLSPFLVFNQICRAESLQLKASFRIEAFCVPADIQLHQQLREDHLRSPVLNEQGEPWSMDVEELAKVSSWCISKRKDGKFWLNDSGIPSHTSPALSGVTKADIDALKNLSADIGVLKQRLNDYDTTIEVVQTTLADNRQGVQDLKTTIVELETKMSALKTVEAGHVTLHSGLSDIKEKLEHCRSDTSALERDLKTMIGTTKEDMAKLDVTVSELGRTSVDSNKFESALSDVQSQLQDCISTTAHIELEARGQMQSFDGGSPCCTETAGILPEEVAEIIPTLMDSIRTTADRLGTVESDTWELAGGLRSQGQCVEQLREILDSADCRFGDLEKKVAQSEWTAEILQERLQKLEMSSQPPRRQTWDSSSPSKGPQFRPWPQECGPSPFSMDNRPVTPRPAFPTMPPYSPPGYSPDYAY